jgi:hypothetical protein
LYNNDFPDRINLNSQANANTRSDKCDCWFPLRCWRNDCCLCVSSTVVLSLPSEGFLLKSSSKQETQSSPFLKEYVWGAIMLITQNVVGEGRRSFADIV